MEDITRSIILLLLGLLTWSGELYAQSEWELKKDEEGILAYTRSRTGIKFKEYKIEMTIDATHDQLLALFQDYERYPEIFPGTEDVKALLQEEDRYVTYIKFNLPFPARDRDALFDNKLTYNQESKLLHIDVGCLTDEYKTNPKLIQISFCEGFWDFQDLGGGKMKITNQLVVDPGGSAPAWIVNAKAVDDPMKTFKALRKLVNDQKYSGQKFTLLEN